MATQTKASGPMARLKDEANSLVGALTERATSALRDKVEGATGRLTDYVEGDGGPGLMAAVTGAKDLAEGKGPVQSLLGAGFAGAKEKVAGLFGKGRKKGGRQKLKVTNIIESVDVGVPVRVAYNQWTQFRDFPTFTKKVENVETVEDQKLNWKAQVFWSHRTWEATILRQHPDDEIVWRSKGAKGHVDGAVTFHELAPNLTRIVLVMEYHPQGLFERTGNIWRAQGRRARLELKHYARHVMSSVLLNAEEVEGWRGVIEDGQVVKDHQTALEEEQQERDADTGYANGEFNGESGDAAEEREGGEGAERDAEGADDEFADEADEDADARTRRQGNGPDEHGERSAGRRTARADGSGGRRPAAGRASRTDDRPQRGATRGAR